MAANDNSCGIKGLSISRNGFTCNDVGINPVWLYVWDSVGNRDSCLAYVTIRGNKPPNAKDDSVKMHRNLPQLIFVLLNDSDPDGKIDPATVVISPHLLSMVK